LIIENSVSDIIHEFGHDLCILFISYIAHNLDAGRYVSELAFDSIEYAETDSAKDRVRRW